MSAPAAPCEFEHDDAAYVLGALSPAERLEFERHLPTCGACSRSVRGFAGMPGLLDLVDASVLVDPPADPPLPSTLLPSLYRAVEARQRRRTVVVAGIAAAAAAVIALGGPVVVHRVTDDPTASGPASASPSNDVETLDMVADGAAPIRATVGLEQVTWGTRMLLTCSYDREWVDFELPQEVDYLLFVEVADGRTEQVGSWRSIDGTTMQVPAATSVARDDIVGVEVRTSDGRVVLRVAA